MITLPYRIEDLASQVNICRSISYDNAAGVYEIERAFSLIGLICDNINHDLSECYKIKSDGNHNLSAVQAVLDSSRSVDVLKHVRDATTGINSKISDANQCESKLKQLRHEIEHILHTLKSQLERLSSDESTDNQKILSLRSYALRPLLNDNFEGTSTNIHMGFQNGSDYTSEKVKINRVSNHNSMASENNVGNLSPFQSGIGHSEAVSQVSIPASSLSNERIVEGIGGESSTYAVRRRSSTPFFTRSSTSYNNICRDVQVTPEIESIAKWLSDVNPGFTTQESSWERNPYNHNCGSCALAVERNLEGGRSTVAVSTLYTLSDQEMEDETGKTCTYMPRSDIEEYLKSQGAGSHLIIGIDREPALMGLVQRAGHWFNAYYDGNQIVTVDGQCNRIMGWPPEYGHISRWCAMI